MKVLMLWRYYPEMLAYFYQKHPGSSNLPFQEHRQVILDEHFCWPADLSNYMNTRGIETEFVIENAEVLQKQWALENNFESFSRDCWQKEIVLEQIKRFRPDVLWTGSIFDYFGEFVRNALPYCKKAIAWVSCATPKNLDVNGFSVLVTSNPNMLKALQHLFDRVVVTKPGFDSEILKKLGQVKKKHDLVFIGQVTKDHTLRADVLAYLIRNGIDIKVFGVLGTTEITGKKNAIRKSLGHIMKRVEIRKGIKALKNGFIKSKYQRNIEIIRPVCKSPVFGMDNYRKLSESRVGLNIHIDVSGENSGNIRMFETTGVGTCLLSDNKPANSKIFQVGKEILTFDSKEHLLDLIKNLDFNSQQVEDIAQAGQQRTLKDHSMERLFNDILPAFEI
jgi:spore maturation protein CgeB